MCDFGASDHRRLKEDTNVNDANGQLFVSRPPSYFRDACGLGMRCERIRAIHEQTLKERALADSELPKAFNPPSQNYYREV
jgi:hypothetical protein